jgi:hypothetical protein
MDAAAEKPGLRLRDALGAIVRGDLQAANNAAPSLSFTVVVLTVTLAFAVAYALW